MRVVVETKSAADTPPDGVKKKEKQKKKKIGLPVLIPLIVVFVAGAAFGGWLAVKKYILRPPEPPTAAEPSFQRVTDASETEPSEAAPFHAEGVCGKEGSNVAWSLDADGVLKLSGVGETASYTTEKEHPWAAYYRQIRSVEVGNGITALGDNLFRYCLEAERITLPEGLKTIGRFAFAVCMKLPEITIPASVETLTDNLFVTCDSLNTLRVAPGSKTFAVENGMLCTADKKHLIRIPSSTTGELRIPEGFEILGTCAFGPSGVTRIYIPKTVKRIDAWAFDECFDLAAFEVAPDNAVFSSENGYLFSADKTELVAAPAAAGGGSYTVPDTVTAIRDTAFVYTDLTHIVFPASVRTVGKKLCRLAQNDIRLEFSGDAPEMKELPFARDVRVTVVYPGAAAGWAELRARDTGNNITWIDGSGGPSDPPPESGAVPSGSAEPQTEDADSGFLDGTGKDKNRVGF